jgi:gliding motility-associated-like protein
VYNNSVAPGDTFTFGGSIPNDKFAGPSVTVTVNGTLNATIGSNCGGGTTVGSVYGSFTVVAALSKNGGAICCDPGLEDVIPPTFTGCPSNITVSASANCKAVVDWIEPVASDNCSIASESQSHEPNTEFDFGMTTVTYTATDSYGNEGICSFTITVEDTTVPFFTGCPANITVSVSANCKALVNWIEPVANDNCDIASETQSGEPNTEFDVGITTVTYTATDDSGNMGICTFTVTVEDTTVPTFTDCPANITVAAGANCKAFVNWNEPIATDNCGIASESQSDAPNTEFDVGIATVTYTATDVHGNTATCAFTVTVTFTEQPEVTGCPSNLTGISDDADEAVITWVEPVFTSRCGIIDVQQSHEPGDRFRTGVTEVVYTASDGLGNTTDCRFEVVVDLPELDIQISKLVTPDGDGFNEFWKIINLENYPDNHVTIFDRWGSVLYKTSRYDNQSVVWRGTNKDNNIVPNGTYFYVLEVTYGRQKIKREGFIELLR